MFLIRLINYLSWIFPSVKLRVKFKSFLYENIMSKKYGQIIKKIKIKTSQNPDYKVKILFFVSENQKWCAQDLFEELKQNKNFESVIAVSCENEIYKTDEEKSNSAKREFSFFSRLDKNAVLAYNPENHKNINLKEFSPDIVFYQQPWGLAEIHTPAFVSDFALTCYIPYGFQSLNNIDNYTLMFHGFLWKYFVESEINIKRFKKTNNAKNCITTGYPKFDVYLKKSVVDEDKLWKIPKNINPNIKRVIYAPHHSFFNTVKFATFAENGQFILEYAKNHSEIDWIFKPHPTFKQRLAADGIMSPKEAEQYYKDWDSLPNAQIYDKGNYFDIFKTSDALITDCVSFLAEYLPTKKPVLFLKSNKGGLSFNELGEKIVENYYHINNTKELEETIKKVIIAEEDYLHDKRVSAIKYLEIDEKSASSKIAGYLEKELGLG